MEPPSDSRVDLIATCLVCGVQWDIDRDPTRCRCEDPLHHDWTLEARGVE
jgi:hypothetical protein